MMLIDNIHTTLVADLRTTLASGSRLSIAASYFSIYAYQELRKRIRTDRGPSFYLYLSYIHYKEKC